MGPKGGEMDYGVFFTKVFSLHVYKEVSEVGVTHSPPHVDHISPTYHPPPWAVAPTFRTRF